eukprot:11748370-Karenia_brevis.AAC.1
MNGSRRGLEGPTMGCHLTYCRLHDEWQTPLRVMENVPQCPTDHIAKLNNKHVQTTAVEAQPGMKWIVQDDFVHIYTLDT